MVHPGIAFSLFYMLYEKLGVAIILQIIST